MTEDINDVQTMGGTTLTTSLSHGSGFYFQYAVMIIGIVGTTANALILYAMVASKQHKKQLLIFNQNALDLCSCVLLVVIFTMKICNIHLTGTLGYWLCMILLSENLLWISINGSTINLMSITIERYIKVVHPKWSKKLLRKWVRCSAAAFAWIIATVYSMALTFSTSAVIDGVCYGYVIWKSKMAAVIHGIWNYGSFFLLAIFVFIFCYGKILLVIRRQAHVMASHSCPGQSTSQSQTQSSQIQSNIIKTMILVSTFYVITWTPSSTFFLITHIYSDLTLVDTVHYVFMFLGFFYISANPFIYAMKFNPVRRVLVGLIPWKKSQQASVSNIQTKH